MRVKLKYVISFIPIVNILPLFLWIVMWLRGQISTAKYLTVVFLSSLSFVLPVIATHVGFYFFSNAVLERILYYIAIHIAASIVSISCLIGREKTL